MRKSTILALKKISKKQGEVWAEEAALNILKKMKEHKNYLYRANYLFGIGEIYKYIKQQTLE